MKNTSRQWNPNGTLLGPLVANYERKASVKEKRRKLDKWIKNLNCNLGQRKSVETFLEGNQRKGYLSGPRKMVGLLAPREVEEERRRVGRRGRRRRVMMAADIYRVLTTCPAFF